MLARKWSMVLLRDDDDNQTTVEFVSIFLTDQSLRVFFVFIFYYCSVIKVAQFCNTIYGFIN